jgi:hypothetical protein
LQKSLQVSRGGNKRPLRSAMSTPPAGAVKRRVNECSPIADTGAAKWFDQYNPHDQHDYGFINSTKGVDLKTSRPTINPDKTTKRKRRGGGAWDFA